MAAFSSLPAYAEETAAKEGGTAEAEALSVPATPLAEEISRLLSGTKSIDGVVLVYRGEALAFYEGRAFAPAWSGGRSAVKDSDELLSAVESASTHGLSPSRYHLQAIEALQARLDEAGDSEKDGLAARLDLIKTDAFLSLAHDFECGVTNPFHSNANQRKPRCDIDLSAILTEAVNGDSVKGALESLPPQNERYARLREALAKMREKAANASWPQVSGGKKKIEPGDTDPRVAEVRNRLAAEGYIEAPGLSKAKSRKEINEEMQATSVVPGDDFYDPKLEEAVKRFQRDFGLADDGVIGARTQLMMNRQPDWRVCQIAINLDRLRSLDHVITTERYALVNVPDFSLNIFEGGKPTHKMKVIVGRLDRKSPLMSDRIRFIVFSPKWHVPTSIAVKDKLPKIKKDPSFIRRHGMKVYAVGDTGIEEIEPESVDWSSVDAGNFSYRIVQAAGDANALGRVKFMFPNRHAVYLHDTPTKYLFKRDKRTYSSGCIRIEDPIWFAEYLLSDKEEWDRDRISASMSRATPMHVPISEEMPIHILYLTAWGDENGNPVFRHDVYGYDKVAAKELCD